MKIIRYISYLLPVMSILSCDVADATMDWVSPPISEPDMISQFIGGQVFDTDDNRLEHIRATIDWGKGIDKTVKYTASDGSFMASFPQGVEIDGTTITITLDDIDGEANGGLFNSLTDNIVYSSNPDSPTGILVYRLSRATASESSLQP